MAIQMSENFKLLSKEALDGRISYKSLSEMVSMQDSYLYDGCLATIEGDTTKKIYQWWSSNAIDSTLGKWRELKFNEDIINDEIISTESTWSSKKIDEQIKLKDVIKDDFISIVTKICNDNDFELVEINTDEDHVHLLLGLSPQDSIPVVMKTLKGVSARLLNAKHRDLIQKHLCGERIWSPSYYIATTSDNLKENIIKYIKSQGE